MKRKHVSSLDKDPPLCDGLGYLTKEEPYRAYLQKNQAVVQEVRPFLLHYVLTSSSQPSKCVAHDAVNTADTKKSHGVETTGIGTVDCARHGMKRPRSMGPLQKGERCVWNRNYALTDSTAAT